jgi:hypothetical protein
MPKEEITDLTRFLAPFPEEVQQTALWLRAFVWDLYPESNELIYDNYNALAFGFALSDRLADTFCSIAVYAKHVNFGFNRGSEIADPLKMLSGEGSQYRYLPVPDTRGFPTDYVIQLLNDAYTNALSRQKPAKIVITGQTITKSISPKKRRPG